MKIDFTRITVPVSFDGTTQTFNIASQLGNDMMYNSSVICDIGFEELAKEIYYSKGEVEIPTKYVQPLIQVISQKMYLATIKRYLLQKLCGK